MLLLRNYVPKITYTLLEYSSITVQIKQLIFAVKPQFKSSVIFKHAGTQYNTIFYKHKISHHCPFIGTHMPFSCFRCLTSHTHTHTHLSRIVLSAIMFTKASTVHLQNSVHFQNVLWNIVSA